MPVLRDWYTTVLGLAVVFESDDLCLLTFDNEHHRLALLHADAAHTPNTKTNGIEHAALTTQALAISLIMHPFTTVTRMAIIWSCWSRTFPTSKR
jgi:catechol-2,3-dioxygenase